ncbi:hypothetical protein ACP4OV_009050 [Aristida adscensionis]
MRQAMLASLLPSLPAAMPSSPAGAAALLLLALLLRPPQRTATADTSFNCDDNTNSYPPNGTYQTNLDSLAASLPATASSAAASGYATASAGAAPDQVYGLALCRGDTNASACAACVAAAFGDATRGCPLDKAVSVYRDACVLRFSGERFLDFLTADQWIVSELVTATTSSLAGRKRNVAAISAVVSCSGVLILIVSVSSSLLFRRRINATKTPMEIGRAKCMTFDFPTLQEATENFSEKNKLGEGGFGIVYKGTLSDGQEIAVKKLLGTTGHGLNQLQNEVVVLAELQHKNLVRLQGFCSYQNETLLVYEYIKNGSLDGFLFDANRRNELSWEQQHNIILGIAKGILYLHEDSSMRIIHRDLKSNNILLDDDMGPKIADFGLAKLLGEGHTHTQTTRPAGTLGYMAPEYALLGNVSPKIDIFSFGVLVLEIVTRRSNSSYDDQGTVNLLTDIWDSWMKGTISQMLDQSVDGYGRSQALRCTHVGLLCVQSKPEDRPDITSVVFMLTRDNMELQSPVEPAFYFGREPSIASLSSGQSCSMNDRSGSAMKQDITVNEVTVTEPYPR